MYAFCAGQFQALLQKPEPVKTTTSDETSKKVVSDTPKKAAAPKKTATKTKKD